MVQYYEMMGTRALWHEGWHVVAQRAPQQGGNAADFVNDTWELYHSEEDRSEVHDLAAEHPDKVKELVNLWYVEAGKYDVLPLDNRSMEELVKEMPVAEIPEGGIYRYYPSTSPVPEFDAAEIRGRSFKILAQVEHHRRRRGGRAPRQRRPVRRPLAVHQGPASSGTSTTSSASRPSSSCLARRDRRRQPTCSAMEFAKEGHGEHGEALGTATLYVDDLAVAKSEWKTQPGHFALCGEGLTVGRDSSDPVSKEYGAAVRLHRRPDPGGGDQHRRRRLPRPRAGLPRRDGPGLRGAPRLARDCVVHPSPGETGGGLGP